MRIDQAYVTGVGRIACEAWIAWCVDVETGNKVFMAVVLGIHDLVIRESLVPDRAVASQARTSTSDDEDTVHQDSGADEIVMTRERFPSDLVNLTLRWPTVMWYRRGGCWR